MASRRPRPFQCSLWLRILLGAAATGWLQGAALPDPQKGHVLVPGEGFTDERHVKHTRLAHFYHGLRVLGSEAILHEAADAAAKDRPGPDVTCSPDLILADQADPGQAPLRPLPIQVDLQVRLEPKAVRKLIRTLLGPAGQHATFLSFEKVIYPVVRLRVAQPAEGEPLNAADVTRILDHYRLAWLVSTRVPAKAGWEERWDFIVAAHDGTVLQRTPGQAGYTPEKGRGNTWYSGEVALDTVLRKDGHYQLLDSTRGIKGRNAVILRDDQGVQAIALETKDNVWGSGRPGLGLKPDRADLLTNAADAAYSLRCAWDYFRNIHGREGPDGKGAAVHVEIQQGRPDYACYFKEKGINRIRIGPGGEFLPWTDVVTIGHEFAHAVNGASAGLAMAGEAGALNEANSDIFSKLIETYALRHRLEGKSIGEPIHWKLLAFEAKTGEERLCRSMRQPSLDGSSRDTWSRLVASQTPHQGAGPMNRAFTFLAAGASGDASDSTGAYSALLPSGMAGIGTDRAARIWYRALTTRLLSQSTYLDARAAMIVAAEELHGRGSAEVQAVRMAMGAVGVGDPDPAPELGAQAARCTATPTLAKGILTVTAAGPGIRSARFLVDGLQVRHAPKPPFQVIVDTPRCLANGPHVWEVAVTCADRTTGTFSGRIELDNPSQQVLADPDLVDPGDRSWGPGRAATRASQEAGFDAGGRTYAVFSRVLGQPASGARVLSQVVKIPAGCREVTLRYWAWVQPSVGQPEQDSIRFLIRSVPAAGGSPELLADVDTLTGHNGTKGWQHFGDRVKALENLAEARTVEVRIEASLLHRDATFRLANLGLFCETAAPEAAELKAAPAGSPAVERKEPKEDQAEP